MLFKKRLLLSTSVATVILAASAVPTAQANDRTGALVIGALAGAAIGYAVTAPRVGYVAPPVIYAPPPQPVYNPPVVYGPPAVYRTPPVVYGPPRVVYGPPRVVGYEGYSRWEHRHHQPYFPEYGYGGYPRRQYY